LARGGQAKAKANGMLELKVSNATNETNFGEVFRGKLLSGVWSRCAGSAGQSVAADRRVFECARCDVAQGLDGGVKAHTDRTPRNERAGPQV